MTNRIGAADFRHCGGLWSSPPPCGAEITWIRGAEIRAAVVSGPASIGGHGGTARDEDDRAGGLPGEFVQNHIKNYGKSQFFMGESSING